MTTEQYERWKDFALRMARTAFRGRRRPTTAWIVEAVEDFFGRLPEEDIVCLVDWDNSDDYPQGHRYYQRTYRCPCWHCSRVRLLPSGQRDPGCPYGTCEDGKIFDYAHPYCMGDTMSEWETDYVYYAFHDLANAKELARFEAARNRGDDDAEDAIRDRIADIYTDPVSCCVRAGMDLASAPSAGVVGFTVGDLRRMYPEGVPAWVSGDMIQGSPFEEAPHDAPRIDFASVPDDAPIWL